MALVDSNCKFIYVDVGANGRISDGGIFKNGYLYKALENKTLSTPNSTPLRGRTLSVPYVIIADDAFPLKEYLLKPYSRADLWNPSKKIFNYRLSRARRTVENAFGILASRFRIFGKPIQLEPHKVDIIILACCALHNYLISNKTTRTIYSNLNNYNNEESGFRKLCNQASNTYSCSARRIREEFTNYFSTSGSIPWQWNL